MPTRPYYKHIFSDNAFHWEEVPDALPVVIPGYEQFEFFAHQDPRSKRWYIITEAHTGMLVWSGITSKKNIKILIDEFVASATSKLTPELMAQRISESIAKHGESPRYQREECLNVTTQ